MTPSSFCRASTRGDDIDPGKLEEIKIRLVSSGLFKDVKVYTQEVAGGVKLVLEVKDKFPWAAAPTYYNQPTNKGVGLGYGHNNLFGENKKLLMYAQVATGDSFFVAGFKDPNVKNTRFNSQIGHSPQRRSNIRILVANPLSRQHV